MTSWLRADLDTQRALASAWVVPEPSRCVQCGVCSFNCPAGIDVRRLVWREEPVKDGHCLACGQCVRRCPRGLLRFERVSLAPSALTRGGPAATVIPEPPSPGEAPS